MSDTLTEKLSTALIRTDGGTQQRERLNPEVVKDYAALMADGATFPPIEVVYDGAVYWLQDGFHRLEAAKHIGLATIAANVARGDLSDAIWQSASANATHGLRRTNKDKANAVRIALQHPRAKGMSDRDIASHVGVSHTLVSQIAAELHDAGTIDRKRDNGRKVNAARISGGSPLKQMDKWWAQAPEPEKRALFQRVQALYQSEFGA